MQSTPETSQTQLHLTQDKEDVALPIRIAPDTRINAPTIYIIHAEEGSNVNVGNGTQSVGKSEPGFLGSLGEILLLWVKKKLGV